MGNHKLQPYGHNTIEGSGLYLLAKQGQVTAIDVHIMGSTQSLHDSHLHSC